MSAARIIPFPIAKHVDITPDLPQTMASFTNTAADDEAQAVTTVIITPTPGEGWVPPLSQRYPSVFESFAHWAAAERVGDELVIR